jgi:hypothetical protein
MSEDPLPKRIKIEGLPGAKFELPPMHKVWKNASEGQHLPACTRTHTVTPLDHVAPKLRENGGVKPCLGQVARGSLGMMPVPLVCECFCRELSVLYQTCLDNLLVPNLFRFAYACHTDDGWWRQLVCFYILT